MRDVALLVRAWRRLAHEEWTLGALASAYGATDSAGRTALDGAVRRLFGVRSPEENSAAEWNRMRAFLTPRLIARPGAAFPK